MGMEDSTAVWTEGHREKRRVALGSVVAAVFLTSMKLAVGLWTGSLGILSEAAHSGLDLLAAIITVFAVRISARPADKDHPFGHGKVENLSALAETLLLLFTCVWILVEAYERLVLKTVEIDVNVYSFAVIGISILVDITRSRALRRAAVKYHSQALEADALHFSTDVYSSAVVIVGLIFVKFGFVAGDAISAIVVALIVVWISIRLGGRTIAVLLDTEPKGVRERVVEAVRKLDGVENVRSIRVRESGASTFIDLVIGIHRTATFDRVHQVMDAVEAEVRLAVPRSDVIVHSEPVIGRNERISDSVNWIVQQTGLSAHNITVLESDGAYIIQLDIEYPPETSFERAHTLASDIEDRIRERLPAVQSVSVHLEGQRQDPIPSVDVSAEEQDLIATIARRLDSGSRVLRANTIRCFRTARGLKLDITCVIDGRLSLRQAHDVVDGAEKDVSALDPRIIRVFIHAEPE